MWKDVPAWNEDVQGSMKVFFIFKGTLFLRKLYLKNFNIKNRELNTILKTLRVSIDLSDRSKLSDTI